MSLRARMLLSFVRGSQAEPRHAFSWEHAARVIAASLIGEGV